MPIFGNQEVGDEFIHHLNSDIWGSFFTAPENGYAKSITVYVKNGSKSGRLRSSLYEEYVHTPPPPYERRYMRFVMSTEEKIIPPYFEGWVTLIFTAPPPIKTGTVYYINAWRDEYGTMTISTKSGVGKGIEWTVYMAGGTHGLGYPRYYEIIPQHRRGAILCSIYCTYMLAPPLRWECPYCRTEFGSYKEVLEHIMATPTEMIHLKICTKCGWAGYLECKFQKHQFEKHGIGSLPTSCSCIFCDFVDPTSGEVYKHINDNHQPEYEGELPMSFGKTVTVTAKEAKQFKWILSGTEPTALDGYERFPELDLDFGVLGKYWAFVKTA